MPKLLVDMAMYKDIRESSQARRRGRRVQMTREAAAMASTAASA
jgi:hypothetical protein